MSEQFSILIDSRTRFETSEPGGVWLSMPTTKEQLHEAMQRVGITADNPQDFLINGFMNTEQQPFDVPLPVIQSAGLDELNYLGNLLSMQRDEDRNKFTAAVTLGERAGNIKDLINLAQNLDCYWLYPTVQNEEDYGYYLTPTKDGNNLVCILPDNLTSPKLTAEWENNLTQIAKGAADPDEFLSGIEAMARELVKSYPFLSDSDKERFKTEKPEIGKCPRCGSPVHEGKKNYYCSDRDCAFVMWKNDRFFEDRKVTFSPKIAAALLKSGKVKVKGLYSPKTGKTYDGTVVLADTGGKYVNYKIELPKKK